MPVKIRLQRRGKKGKPYFWILAADGRSKRDGKYLEKIGFYNPTTNPAQIDLDVDLAVKWLQNGAQPTDTVRAILSYKGALLKNHLAGGVRKGALTEEQAEAKFNEWLETKRDSIDSKKATLTESEAKAKADKLTAEKAVSDKRAAEAAAAAAPAEEEATENVEATAETATEEVEATEGDKPAAKSAIEEAAAEAKEDNSSSAKATEDKGKEA